MQLSDDLFGDDDDVIEANDELGIDYAVGDPGVEQNLQKPPRVVLSLADSSPKSVRINEQRNGRTKTLRKTIVEVKRDTSLNRLLVTFSDGDSLLIAPR